MVLNGKARHFLLIKLFAVHKNDLLVNSARNDEKKTVQQKKNSIHIGKENVVFFSVQLFDLI